MSDIVNPYIAGNPVTGSAMFFGREDVFDFIRRTLKGQHRDNVIVLYGQRRTGKTSVLYQMRSHLSEPYVCIFKDIHTNTEIKMVSSMRLSEPYVCIFMDLHGFALDSLGGFLWELANHILRVLHRDYQIDLPQPNRAEFMADPRNCFENEFLHYVWSACGDRHLLLMLDEAIRLEEQVRAGKLEHNIFEYLRHLMQHHERLSFLFSLGSGLEEMEKEYSFLFSVGLYKKISFLDRDAASALITQPVKDYYQVEPAALERIFQITSGHPYYTQLLCHSLFNRWQQRQVPHIEAQDVDEVLDEAVERGLAVLKHVWEESTPGEKATMAGIAATMGAFNRPVGTEDINRAWAREDVIIPKGEMAKAIRSLIARDVIAGTDKYVFTVDLQRLWVQKYRRLEWVKEEMITTLLPNVAQDLSIQPPPSPPMPAPPSASPRRHTRLSIALITVLTIMLVSLGFGTRALFSQHNPTGISTTPGSIVGHIFFSSSEQFGQDTSQGIVDELTVDLHNILPPHTGKSYYAWLLGESETKPIPLGKLSVNQGTIHYPYAGDQQHDNLLASTSRFLITEEDANIMPVYPSTGPGARIYYAAIPQTPAGSDHFSVLDHLRHLLAEDPKLARKGLHGGLDIWLLRNTREVLQWAGKAQDAWQGRNTNAIRQYSVDILYYLDGQACVQSDLQGVPPGTPTTPGSATITSVSSVALLDLCGQQQIPGYLTHIGIHLDGLIHAPGATPEQLKLTALLILEINHVDALLVQVHQDAQQLVKLTDAQLLQPSTEALLDIMATQAGYAFSGQTNSSINQLQPGVQQIHDDIQRLATLDVMLCPSSITANICA